MKLYCANEFVPAARMAFAPALVTTAKTHRVRAVTWQDS